MEYFLQHYSDIPSSYHLVTWDAINSLAVPQHAKRSRADWTPDQLAVIAPFEGAAVTVQGFLYKAKPETSSPSAARGGESTNCHDRLAPDVDWHMPLTAHVREQQDVAIVVETPTVTFSCCKLLKRFGCPQGFEPRYADLELSWTCCSKINLQPKRDSRGSRAPSCSAAVIGKFVIHCTRPFS